MSPSSLTIITQKADDALGDLNEGKRTIENGDDDEEKLAAVEAVGAGQTMDRGAAGAHERTGEVHELPDEEAELEKLVKVLNTINSFIRCVLVKSISESSAWKKTKQ